MAPQRRIYWGIEDEEVVLMAETTNVKITSDGHNYGLSSTINVGGLQITVEFDSEMSKGDAELDAIVIQLLDRLAVLGTRSIQQALDKSKTAH